jgi:hypothetical protein
LLPSPSFIAAPLFFSDRSIRGRAIDAEWEKDEGPFEIEGDSTGVREAEPPFMENELPEGDAEKLAEVGRL